MKPKSELMREMRKKRKEAGLIEFRAWVTPETKVKLIKLEKKLSK